MLAILAKHATELLSLQAYHCASAWVTGVSVITVVGWPSHSCAHDKVWLGAVGPREWGHGLGHWSGSRAHAFSLPVWCGPTLASLNAVATADTAKSCGLVIVWQVHSCRCISGQVFDRETGGPFALQTALQGNVKITKPQEGTYYSQSK